MTGRDLTRRARLLTLVVFNLLAWGMVVSLMLQGACLYSQNVQPQIVDTLSNPVGVRVLEVREIPQWVGRLVEWPGEENEADYLVVRRSDWDEQNRDISRARYWMIRADQLIDACTMREVSP